MWTGMDCLPHLSEGMRYSNQNRETQLVKKNATEYFWSLGFQDISHGNTRWINYLLIQHGQSMEIPYLRASYIAGKILDFPAMFDYQYGYGSNIDFFHPDL